MISTGLAPAPASGRMSVWDLGRAKTLLEARAREAARTRTRYLQCCSQVGLYATQNPAGIVSAFALWHS